MQAIKPLFIPLKKQYYEEFVSGTKTVEYRKYGLGWNEDTCQIGRPVVISLGYGKNRRSKGTITSFGIIPSTQVPSAREVYGTQKVDIAMIGIDLTDIDFIIE